MKKLVVMLKFPRAGAVKTRLIPALGARRACELHRALAAHTLGEVRRFASRTSVAVEVRLADAPDAAAARAWLGDSISIQPQGVGNLGERLERAARESFTEGETALVMIGGDCPELNSDHLTSAFAQLAHTDVVLGPADDGGYYLIGMRRFRPELFQEIAWSTDVVLDQTLAAARQNGIGVSLLPALSDVDRPEDLPAWARTPSARATGAGRISVVIPVLNEEKFLPATLAAAQRGAPYETIVVDGGSTDRSREIARVADAMVVAGARGRAAQMNLGAAVATGEYLLFLHADTLLPENFAAQIHQTLARPRAVAGAFAFGIAEDFPGRRWIERGANWRASLGQRPYGDQGLFLRRELFAEMGGFPVQPIMEDHAFVARLRRRGEIAIAPGRVRTSGRRWRCRGAWRTMLLNQAILVAYRLGVPPATLAAWYHGGHGIDPAPARPSFEKAVPLR